MNLTRLTANAAEPQPKLDPEGENFPLNNMLVSRVFEIYYGRESESFLEFSKLLKCKWLTANG
jgi:hypothetical protein